MVHVCVPVCVFFPLGRVGMFSKRVLIQESLRITVPGCVSCCGVPVFQHHFLFLFFTAPHINLVYVLSPSILHTHFPRPGPLHLSPGNCDVSFLDSSFSPSFPPSFLVSFLYQTSLPHPIHSCHSPKTLL